MLKFGFKVGLAGGACYYMAKEGVWRESEESLKVYDKINQTVKPVVDDISAKIPIEIPQLPKSERVSFLVTHYWNAGVINTFEFLQNLPEHLGRLGCKTMQFINGNPELKKMLHTLSPSEAAEAAKAKSEEKKGA